MTDEELARQLAADIVQAARMQHARKTMRYVADTVKTYIQTAGKPATDPEPVAYQYTITGGIEKWK